jgi:hypothetical protein
MGKYNRMKRALARQNELEASQARDQIERLRDRIVELEKGLAEGPKLECDHHDAVEWVLEELVPGLTVGTLRDAIGVSDGDRDALIPEVQKIVRDLFG